MIPATLVIGATAATREAAIAAAIADLTARTTHTNIAIILEGLPHGSSPLDSLSENFSSLHIARIAPGCLCCTGNLTMRVTLNRMLRKRPDCFYIGLASAQHLKELRQFLSAAPYDDLLQLTKDLPV